MTFSSPSSNILYLTRSSSPCRRRIGCCPDTRCRSEAPWSNINLKNASIFAILPAPFTGDQEGQNYHNPPGRSTLPDTARIARSGAACRIDNDGPPAYAGVSMLDLSESIPCEYCGSTIPVRADSKVHMVKLDEGQA